MIGTALLAAGIVQAPASAEYPSTAVLTAFGEVCRDIKDLKRTQAKAVAAGWQLFAPDADSPMGHLLNFAYTEGKKMADAQGGSISPMVVFKRDVAGEALIAVLSGVRVGKTIVNGCRVYDVGEQRRITPAEGARWVGRAPSKADADSTLSVTNWEPGYAPDHDSFELYHVPVGSPAVEYIKVDGLALKADFVGAAK